MSEMAEMLKRVGGSDVRVYHTSEAMLKGLVVTLTQDEKGDACASYDLNLPSELEPLADLLMQAKVSDPEQVFPSDLWRIFEKTITDMGYIMGCDDAYSVKIYMIRIKNVRDAVNKIARQINTIKKAFAIMLRKTLRRREEIRRYGDWKRSRFTV